MRLAAALIFLAAACGSSDRSKDDKPVATNEDEDPCDPKEPKVCVGNSVVSCEANGRLGRRLRTCKDGCKGGRCVASCDDDAVKLIYLVDDANNFLSYDPRKSGDPFRLIGKLNCGTYASPFSMSVDREGTAWVVYQSGDLYKVNIHDAKCTPSGFAAGSSGSRTFGMGFVTDDAGGKTEKLYISAENYDRGLSAIETDKSPPQAKSIGTIEASIDRNPELTGTSEGKLFGFFPVSGNEQSFIQEINKKTGGAVGQKWNVGQLGSVTAWAFAQWGGIFFVFVTTDSGPQVRAVDRKSGESKIVMESIPYRITGAGVSTCAPELDKGQAGP
ncbi:MAG: hypothetical protein H0V17_09240 [Deltaproteobacteria bacterium]|nr:hypothetical protein [Deltaproteobacteria bacterium]